MRNLLLVFVLLLALFSQSNAFANSEVEAKAKDIAEQWQKWVNANNAGASSIAIGYQGQQVFADGLARSANDAMPVASLSKAITGICIAKLVDAGELTFETKISELVSELKSDATIARLLTHSSGFKADVTQSSLRWVKDRTLESLELVSLREVEKNKGNVSDKSYHYNNANYQMLGWAISKITTKPYEAACNDLVLKPIGIVGAKLYNKWRMMAAAGAWKISASDYLKFVNAYFSKKGVMDIKPETLPNTGFSWGGYYGLGTFYRPVKNSGYHFWHFGSWDWRKAGEEETFGAYFVRWDNGWSVSINYDIAPNFDNAIALDQSLSRAAYK